MLVLSRKTTEGIAIGPDIVVKVLKIKGDRIQLGIEAPRELVVRRTEVVDERGKESA